MADPLPWTPKLWVIFWFVLLKNESQKKQKKGIHYSDYLNLISEIIIKHSGPRSNGVQLRWNSLNSNHNKRIFHNFLAKLLWFWCWWDQSLKLYYCNNSRNLRNDWLFLEELFKKCNLTEIDIFVQSVKFIIIIS